MAGTVKEAKKELLRRLEFVVETAEGTATEQMVAAVAAYYLTCEIEELSGYALGSRVTGQIDRLASRGHGSS